MLKYLYRRILQKLHLSKDQLFELRARLTKQNVCRGPFLQEGKMCPNTTALAIREGVAFRNSEEVRTLLKKHGVTAGELWSFYILFDLPAMLSDRIFEKLLKELKAVVEELLSQR